uniref:Uncharacterized protein n=1 Tax=uncultured prokaryote TaxID=198431 RepID=A0A0H5PYQ1_9ZZZZ|nr:hypothetical protein [uncultured prokaryote]
MVFEPIGPTRKLPFPLYNQVSNENTLEPFVDRAPFVFPEDPEERTLVPLFVSQREFTAIVSAMDVGADIAYPLQYVEVMYILLRNLRYPPMICSMIIDCIENDSDTQNALSNFIAMHPSGSEYPKNEELPSGASSANISIDNPTCEKDILWAQCVGMVQTANRMIEDFLQQWETYNNSAETIPAIIQSIPFVGEVADVIGIDGIADYANALIDAVAEGYLADYTLEYEEALACEIFCLAKEDCIITLDMLVDVMNSRISGQLTLDNALELMLSLIDADISGINVADLYLAAFFNMLKLGNLVMPISWGIENYLRVTRVFNTPSDDWMILCTDCPEPIENCQDLTIEAYGWYASNSAGIASTAWGTYDNGLAPNATTLGFFFCRPAGLNPPALAVDSVTFFFNQAISSFTMRRLGGSAIVYSGSPVTEVTFSEATHPAFFPLNINTPICISTASTLAPNNTLRVIQWCWDPV